MKVQIPISSNITDEQLQFIRELGVAYVAVTFSYEGTNYDTVARLQERMAKYDITITDGGCNELFKCASIHLGKEDRDQAIDRYNDFTRVLGKTGIPIGFIAWQPNGIIRTQRGVGQHTRGAVSAIANMEEIALLPVANGREYGEEEIWKNFKYFLEKTLPVCQEANVKMALHPNDPPVESLLGVHSLIYNSECFRKAFAIADNSPYLGMKLCIGCWLEGGEIFGNVMEDITEFVKADKVLSVHFRNVSSPLPYFEETLAEDGYADMYAIMKQLVHSGYKGVISVDHAFFSAAAVGGYLASLGCSTMYMKGLLHAANAEASKLTLQSTMAERTVAGLVVAEPHIISEHGDFFLELDVMAQGAKKTLKTKTLVSTDAQAIKEQLKPGNLYEFKVAQTGGIVVATNPIETFQTLFSREKSTEPVNWVADSAFVFDAKNFGVELSNGQLVAAGWVLEINDNTITLGDGNTFCEKYIVSPDVKVYEIDKNEYSASKVSNVAAIQASTGESRKQTYLVFDKDYANSHQAKVAEIYYFSTDVPMPKDLGIMNAPWIWGHEPFNLLGDVYCVGDKEAEIYLLNSAKGTVLVDTGWSNSAYQYDINIKKLGFDPRKIDYIILSHAHLDHYGTVKHFVKMNPHVKVLMSADDYPYLMSQNTGIKIDGFYKWEEYLDFDNVKVKPIFTPGHTAGTASFIFDIFYNGKSYKAGYMGGYGVNGMTQEDLKKSHNPEKVLKHRLEFRDSLMHLQQNEEVDFVAPQHINQYPILEKWASRIPGSNPFVDLNNPDKSQFVKQLERRIEVIKAIIAADGPKAKPKEGVTGYIASEPKIIAGWVKDVGYLGLNTEPDMYFVQLNIIFDSDNRNRVLRTTAVYSIVEAEAIKEKIKLGDYIQFDLDEVEDIVAVQPENTFKVIAK